MTGRLWPNAGSRFPILPWLIAIVLSLPGTLKAQTAGFEYDELGRLITATYSDGTVIAYSYDPTGNRTALIVTRPDNPGTLQLAQPAYSAGEASGGVTILVRRLGGVTGAVSASIDTADGTAQAGVDYSAASDVLSWTDGDGQDKAIVVTILDDITYEGDEAFTVSISAPAGATLGPPTSATITIVDDEVAPSGIIQFSPSSYDVDEGDSTATIGVSRINGSAGVASVEYATSPGSASGGVDYETVSGTLQWTDGDSSDKTIEVSIVDDTETEGVEAFTLTLSNATGATLGAAATAQVMITDNDLVDVPNSPAAISPTYDQAFGASPPFQPPNVSVNWTPPASGPQPTYYELQQATNSANFATNLSIVYSGAALAWSAHRLGGPDPLYQSNWFYYRVRACNASGECSAWREMSVWEICGAQHTCNLSE